MDADWRIAGTQLKASSFSCRGAMLPTRRSLSLKIKTMRTVKDNHTDKYLKFATCQADITRYLWEYHKISTDIMKSAKSWYILVHDKWFGCGTSTLDRFPIQHWQAIYQYLLTNPESTVACMPYTGYECYLLDNNRDITINHSKYKSYLL